LQVVGVPGGTREVLLNAGNVHCITQQHIAL
jgi:agmatine/peptidylarginine deiminase